jgi:hypothetical protein
MAAKEPSVRPELAFAQTQLAIMEIRNWLTLFAFLPEKSENASTLALREYAKAGLAALSQPRLWRH